MNDHDDTAAHAPADAASEDPFGVVERLRRLIARRPVDETARTLFDRLLRKAPDGTVLPEPALVGITREARGLVLTGPTGAGKSTLVHKLLSEHPAFPGFGTPGSGCRALSVTVQSPATLKSLGSALLDELGWRAATRATEGDIWRIVKVRLHELGYTVVHLDEGQRIAQNRSPDEIKNICDTWITLLQQPNPVVLVLSGVESLLTLVNGHPQCFRRFFKLSLPPLSALDVEEIAGAILAYCIEAGIRFEDDDHIVPRLIHASGSRFGMAMEFAVDAIAEALLLGDDALTLGHFADAYAFRTGCFPGENPFMAHAWKDVPVAEASEDGPEAESQPARGYRKKKGKKS